MLEQVLFDNEPMQKDEYKQIYKPLIEKLVVAQQRAIT